MDEFTDEQVEAMVDALIDAQPSAAWGIIASVGDALLQLEELGSYGLPLVPVEAISAILVHIDASIAEAARVLA